MRLKIFINENNIEMLINLDQVRCIQPNMMEENITLITFNNGDIQRINTSYDEIKAELRQYITPMSNGAK